LKHGAIIDGLTQALATGARRGSLTCISTTQIRLLTPQLKDGPKPEAVVAAARGSGGCRAESADAGIEHVRRCLGGCSGSPAAPPGRKTNL
jgi:hypothetical protein